MSMVTPEQQVRALAADAPSLVTLPPRAACPAELTAAVECFCGDERPAAQASATWLRERALDEHGSARTYLWVGQGQALAFFALSAGVGQLKPAQRTALAGGPYPMPAVLLAQAARRPDAPLGPGVILQSALGMAARIEQLVGVRALMLDPYDEPTAQMWTRRGFQPVLDKPREGQQRRLWRALGPA